jgi:MFS family permease
VILTALRFIPGVGVGGEWGGSVLLAMEWAKGNHNRGLIASIPQLGGPGGLLLANGTVLASMSTEAFLARGWRVPFFLASSWWRLGSGFGSALSRHLPSSELLRKTASSACRYSKW